MIEILFSTKPSKTQATLSMREFWCQTDKKKKPTSLIRGGREGSWPLTLPTGWLLLSSFRTHPSWYNGLWEEHKLWQVDSESSNQSHTKGRKKENEEVLVPIRNQTSNLRNQNFFFVPRLSQDEKISRQSSKFVTFFSKLLISVAIDLLGG